MKKIPERMCVICKTRREKKDLVRVVLHPDETVTFDPTGKAAGRGAYLCKSEECIKAELKAHRLARGLKHPISEADFDSLTKEILAECEKT